MIARCVPKISKGIHNVAISRICLTHNRLRNTILTALIGHFFINEISYLLLIIMINSFILTKNGDFLNAVQGHELRNCLKDDRGVVWVDLEAATDTENQILSDLFHFHPLAIEDCLNISHHPKLDDYDDYLFLVLHAVNFGRKKDEELSTLDLNIFVCKNYILTYFRKPSRRRALG